MSVAIAMVVVMAHASIQLEVITVPVILGILSIAVTNTIVTVCIVICCKTYMYVNLFPCIDINECNQGSGECEHTCTDTIGSFTCSCNTGYQLMEERYCSGKL